MVFINFWICFLDFNSQDYIYISKIVLGRPTLKEMKNLCVSDVYQTRFIYGAVNGEYEDTK